MMTETWEMIVTMLDIHEHVNMHILNIKAPMKPLMKRVGTTARTSHTLEADTLDTARFSRTPKHTHRLAPRTYTFSCRILFTRRTAIDF